MLAGSERDSLPAVKSLVGGVIVGWKRLLDPVRVKRSEVAA